MAFKRSGGGASVTQAAAKFLGVSVLAGVVTAGIALPAVGSMGLAAKGSMESFEELPGELKSPPLSQASKILDSEGGLIATVYYRDRTVVPLKEMSPYIRQAIVAIEDARFYKHGAIDLKGILRALNKNAQEGGVAEGASTLTQQYVKNVFVEQAGNDADAVARATQQTAGRKIQEIKYAIQIEEELGKDKILENYLNITFFGQQAYGVEAASRRYFSKSAKDLTLPEAAMLAGLVQSPSRFDPINAPEEAVKRRALVLQRMADVGDITQAEADKAKKAELNLKVSKPKNGCITAVDGAGFFCDYVRNVFYNDKTFGKTPEERRKRWNEGGLTVRTTLSPKAQKSVQASIAKHVYKDDKVATAVTIVEPGTGKILGMGQSRPYGFGENELQINLSADKDMGGSNYGFQVGSTFKPITAAAALERGVSTAKAYTTSSTLNSNGKPFVKMAGEPFSTCKGTASDPTWNPENENDKEIGAFGMPEALRKSVNTYFVQLSKDIGLCSIGTMAEKMGIRKGDGSKIDQLPSMTLGSHPISPLTMASAYATFASRGTYCTPVAIEEITAADGKKLDVPKSSCSRAMSEKTADSINTMLNGVVEDGTGTKAGLADRQSAGKTGTTDGRKAAWFVGYTPNMSGAVWVGGPTGDVEMTDISIGGVYHQKVFGGGVPGPIWRDAMSGALAGTPAQSFNIVPIAEPAKPADKDKGRDDKGKGERGGNDDTSDRPGFPWPEISLPPDFLGGNDNGGGNGANGAAQGTDSTTTGGAGTTGTTGDVGDISGIGGFTGPGNG
ncbi:transglycosylase domain-containing protein [Streptomyces thermolineatus]|uniref:Transglycosylase domain-containing protein n=1 Tax=Streptomyces thermolineatus TaxID=44033 RepID=A0ABN3LGF2_9ACTN